MPFSSKTPYIVFIFRGYTKCKGFRDFYSDEFFDDPAQTLYNYRNNKQEIQ